MPHHHYGRSGKTFYRFRSKADRDAWVVGGNHGARAPATAGDIPRRLRYVDLPKPGDQELAGYAVVDGPARDEKKE